MRQYIGKDTWVDILHDRSQIEQLVEEKMHLLEKEEHDAALAFCDIGDVINKFHLWKKLFPRVAPFYAMKCNNDHGVVKVLADLGVSFDCASKGEIEQVLDIGVKPSRIIFANPCKHKAAIKYAAEHQVKMMTFDNAEELVKIATYFPDAKLVLRLLPIFNFAAQCELGMKFGCHPDRALALLKKAQELNLNVMGISFHVGSGIKAAEAFAVAIQQAHMVFQQARGLGFKMELLDIGGGFPGSKHASVNIFEIAKVVNEALDEYFPDPDVTIIAEPGRYFVASAFTLYCHIISVRKGPRDIKNADGQILTANDEPSFMYYINDGVYGSFNCILFDHAHVQAHVLKDVPEDAPEFTSSIWGPTCDGLDCIQENIMLPQLDMDEWLYFRDMGAYTMAAASTFNGMPRARKFHWCEEAIWQQNFPNHHQQHQRFTPLKLQLRAGHGFDDLRGEDTCPLSPALMADTL